MDWAAQYLLRLTACAFVCAILSGFPADGTGRPVIRLACGICMALALLDGLRGASVQWSRADWPDLTVDAADAVRTGEALAEKAKTDIITAELEAYILEKAAQMGAEVRVEVVMASASDAGSIGVCITGTVEQRVREHLCRWLAEDLGIPEEDQQWIQENG